MGGAPALLPNRTPCCCRRGRAVEAFAERPLEVMPVHVTDILSGAAAVAVGPEK